MQRAKSFVVWPLVLLCVGCTFNERNSRGTAVGGAVGAGAGALIGAATGSWWKGALFGAGTGALLGYAVSSEPEKPRAYTSSDRRAQEDALRRDDAERHFRLGMDARDSATSEYHLRKSVELYPTPHAWNNLGLIQLQGGDKSAARTSFRNAIELDPRYDPALKNLEKLGAS